MTTATAARGALSARALTTLRAFFDERDHRPSADHWRALSEIVETLEAMADGRCAAKVYLSSCCPGLGKSQSVIHFARALASDPGRQKVGMIICVGRISEAETIATELRLPPGKLAVWTSDEAVNAIGATPHNAAQILVTTQQRVEQRCNQRAVVDTDTFVFSDEFYYRGQPRRVRVWDESFLPGTAVSLHKDDLAGLLTPLRYRFPDLTDSVEELFMQVRACEDGATIPIPDFERLHGVSVEDALEVVEGGREDQRVALTSLFILGGRVARVSRDGVKGNTALSWKDTLPADLAPLLILDASGRVRTTYQDMQDHRGTLVRLRSATKDYSPLVCHLWHKAGSKAGWERHGEDLINGIVRTILTKPDEQWLIVHHKPSRRVPDIIEALRLRLPADVMTRLSFVNWGRHQATNAFAAIPNVILAGSLFMRPSYYQALTYLAQGKAVDRHHLPREDVLKTIAGEHADLLLQAVCRGSVRKSDGDKCWPMHAYLIAAPTSGIPASLAQVFPGCQVQRWEPIPRTFKGHLKAAVEFVERPLRVALSGCLTRLSTTASAWNAVTSSSGSRHGLSG